MQPDEWCELCEVRLGVHRSSDGVWACDDCAKKALALLYGPNRQQRRAAQRRQRLHNNGRPRS